ncbi:hypothetical protein LTR28_006091 [Elasticomyces elasticus]|nr:hypothetical protein LTR28_006091 [Elasticomyces elasticus]
MATNPNTAPRPAPIPRQQAQQSRDSRPSVSRQSSSSVSSDATDSSQMTTLSVNKRSPYTQQTPQRAIASTGSTTDHAFTRPGPVRSSTETPMPSQSPAVGSAQAVSGHRARQHSQGFFEPSLPHASSSNLSASQIAAQAAMQHMQTAQHQRKRSLTIPHPISTNTGGLASRRKAPSPLQTPQVISTTPVGALPYQNGALGGNRSAATTAANVAFPKSPLASPGAPPAEQHFVAPAEKEPKAKEKSKVKLFSKAKHIGISKDRDIDKKHPAMLSPGRNAISTSALRTGFANASTTSLVDPTASSATSLYSSANASTSTLVPADRSATFEREKEKHRHHFLSRQKNKLKDPDHHNLPLSSASSNSRPTDPSAPQSLYSFAPASPGPSSAFSKSMSGLDLRHGGRALREKKKEEKAAAAASAALTPIMSNSSMNLTSSFRDREQGFNAERADLQPGNLDTSVGPFPAMNASVTSFATGELPTPSISQAAVNSLGTNMGLTGMTPDDAWPLLKARLLNIFEGEDIRTPIEDFNMLVSVHVRRCIQKRSPVVLVEDLRELLQTGFSSLGQTLRNNPDERLIPKLVEIWLNVSSVILPFMQAVFLPLDLEFKGHGSIMTKREAAEFWVAPEASGAERPSSAGGTLKLPTLGEELDVRRITLIAFRDSVILPRAESLMAIFSRLSLESINAATTSPDPASARTRGHSNSVDRPGTGGSLSPHFSSFNSQSSTLLDAASSSSGGALSNAGRSRATSNTSAGSFGTSLPHISSPLSSQVQQHQPLPSTSENPVPRESIDPAKVTETVARMLQCASVLASVQTGDEGQRVVEGLTEQIKYNWLGRGRTGRQRRGWVGMTVGGRGVGVAA